MDGTATKASSTSRSHSVRSQRGRLRPLKFIPLPLELPSPLHFTPCSEDIKEAETAPLLARTECGTVSTTRAVNLMTEKLLEMFAQCNASFYYDKRLNPRRVLTKPSRSSYNSGHDNEKHDYILYVNDVLGNEEGRKYVILDLLGQGTFGQVVKCQNVKTKELVAVKVIKNQPAFFNQSMMEVTVLEMLNQKYDKTDRHHIVRMRDTFVFRQHLCIVVELLSLNLYDLIKQNQYRGFSLTLCRMFLAQILDAMKVLKDARIIHCDLKPENILLRNLESPAVKVIDFGSACHEHQTLYTYIQSRFYRSPEVLLGLPYSSAIDMWSLGCIAAELFLGLPIFPGASNYDQISRIVQTLGLPPAHMLEVGKDALNFFERQTVDGRHFQYQLKSRDRYSLDSNRMEPPPKQYFSSTKLEEIITNYPIRPRDMSIKDRELEMANRRCFLDFIKGLLNLNPIERWSPLQAAQHPFISGKPFVSPFIPPIAVALSPTVSSPVSATVAASRVRIGASKQRPRANTLSSLSLQDVPPQIQRITAASREKNAPGVGPTERAAPDVIPDAEHGQDSTYQSQPPLPFESVVYSPSMSGAMPVGSIPKNGSRSSYGAMMAASPSSASQQSQPFGSFGNVNAESMSVYSSNRRVSQPAIAGVNLVAGGRYATRLSNAGLPVVYTPGSSQTVPSSLPNAVWYGPESTFGMSPSLENGSLAKPSLRSNYYSSPRRGSLRPEPGDSYQVGAAPNSNWNATSQQQQQQQSYYSQSASRRSSAPNIQLDAPLATQPSRKLSGSFTSPNAALANASSRSKALQSNGQSPIFQPSTLSNSFVTAESNDVLNIKSVKISDSSPELYRQETNDGSLERQTNTVRTTRANYEQPAVLVSEAYRRDRAPSSGSSSVMMDVLDERPEVETKSEEEGDDSDSNNENENENDKKDDNDNGSDKGDSSSHLE